MDESKPLEQKSNKEIQPDPLKARVFDDVHQLVRSVRASHDKAPLDALRQGVADLLRRYNDADLVLAQFFQKHVVDYVNQISEQGHALGESDDLFPGGGDGLGKVMRDILENAEAPEVPADWKLAFNEMVDGGLDAGSLITHLEQEKAKYAQSANGIAMIDSAIAALKHASNTYEIGSPVPQGYFAEFAERYKNKHTKGTL